MYSSIDCRLDVSVCCLSVSSLVPVLFRIQVFLDLTADFSTNDGREPLKGGSAVGMIGRVLVPLDYRGEDSEIACLLRCRARFCKSWLYLVVQVRVFQKFDHCCRAGRIILEGFTDTTRNSV